MFTLVRTAIMAASIASFIIPAVASANNWDHDNDDSRWYKKELRHDENRRASIELGPRPFFLVNGMTKSKLQKKLASCEKGPFRKTDFSIGHRGAALMFPEHTKESYEAAARMGAGIIECDVTFTKDRELVCRHSQCDLHTTTNILEIPELAAKCSVPFTPYDAATGTPATARCCTSDITLDEFKRLKGKMDASNPKATTVAEYVGGTADWRTDLYTSRGTVMTHAESIQLFKKLGVKMTPELKTPSVEMPYEGDYTQQEYAQQMINEYKAAGVDPEHVFAQSFNLADIKYWLENEPRFGKQAVFLDDRVYTDPDFEVTLADMESLKAQGVNIIAPPMWALLELDAHGEIVPSAYAEYAKAAGLDIITWTFERADLRNGAVNEKGNATWYYQTVGEAIKTDSDMFKVLDVLAKDVGILGMFSDWPATVTYYANCMKDTE